MKSLIAVLVVLGMAFSPAYAAGYTYADLYNDVVAGNTVTVVSGVDKAGYTRVDIPGAPAGVYYCYSVCYGRGVPCKAMMQLVEKIEPKKPLRAQIRTLFP